MIYLRSPEIQSPVVILPAEISERHGLRAALDERTIGDDLPQHLIRCSCLGDGTGGEQALIGRWHEARPEAPFDRQIFRSGNQDCVVLGITALVPPRSGGCRVNAVDRCASSRAKGGAFSTCS